MRRIARSAPASSISTDWPEIGSTNEQLDSSGHSNKQAHLGDERANLHEPEDVIESGSSSVLKSGVASSTNELVGARKLKILRMFGPNSVQNGTQNVTLGKFWRKKRRRNNVNLRRTIITNNRNHTHTNHPKKIACFVLTQNWTKGSL